MFHQLESFLRAQGWSHYGVAGRERVLAALKKHHGVFSAWLRQGYAAGMDYLCTMEADRFDPERKLQGFRSALVLGAWYGQEAASVSGSFGRIARYAAGRDYHKVLRRRLKVLTAALEKQFPGSHHYASADSGPTVDRVLAEAAGLGFFGKNSMLISPQRGSYFFIATLFSTVDLGETPRLPMPNCGTCTHCISACPTGAITAPGVIDASRCISYLTIENKGGIPEELRPKIGNRIFGCDICQEVCPFNKLRAGTQEVLIEELKGKYGAGESLDLREVLAMDSDEAFLQRFAGTPLMRAKRRGLLRNACVVAGNSGDASLIPLLRALLDREGDATLKDHAEWAIGRLTALPDERRVTVASGRRGSAAGKYACD